MEAVTTFTRALRESGLPPEPALVPETPSIVVLDELPWLAEQDFLFDSALQTAWDRLLSPRPVLLLLLGSDLHTMARLTAYDQPFYGRADNLTLGPLNPAETGDALGLANADAIDAHLVSGGLPGILRAWPHATPALTFLEQECRVKRPGFHPEVPVAHLVGAHPFTWAKPTDMDGTRDASLGGYAECQFARSNSLPSGSASVVQRTPGSLVSLRGLAPRPVSRSISSS